jgi:hypothetical protein
MNPNDVIDSYVADVIRRVPTKERNDIGVELHTLLGEMLDDRAQSAGRAPDDAMVLAMLREFGTPSEIASRYRAPGFVIIPADQTRSFAWLSLSGVALQWAFTLPRVTDMHSFTAWYFTWGLGALWWPGFMSMMALLGAWIRQWRTATPSQWKPREFDSDRVNRYAMGFALLWAVIGTALMIALPWIAPHLPGHMPQVLEFNPDFLRTRTWPILVLWLAQIVLLVVVLVKGRWTHAMRRIELAGTLAWLAVLGWLMTMDDIFVSKLTNDGAHFGLGLVIVMLLIDLGIKLYRSAPRLRTPKAATR